MSKTLVLASSNKGKHKEIAPWLSSCGFDVRLQSDFSVPDVDETGLTFIENALLKARNAAEISKLPALADDVSLISNNPIAKRPSCFNFIVPSCYAL